VESTGHCHPKVVKAIQEQAALLIHSQQNIFTSNVAQVDAHANVINNQLSDKLSGFRCLSKLFYSSNCPADSLDCVHGAVSDPCL
jgi:4-aminobutyrate aminotransferase-like enzyme